MTSQFSIGDILKKLAKTRPIFHSEADFQHALAWTIQDTISPKKIRFELPLQVTAGSNSSRSWYLDLFVEIETGNRVAIELKYKTTKFSGCFEEEKFHLKHQSAQDCGRYDFLLDVSRVEQMVKCKLADYGYAIILTNDSSYWSDRPAFRSTHDQAFRIHEGQEITGNRSWPTPLPISVKSRSPAISLNGSHATNWHTYSTIPNERQNTTEFKYLIAQISTTETPLIAIESMRSRP